MGPHWLEMAYWISQIMLTFVATAAAVAAFMQVRTFKLFELLKFLEAPDVRESRRIVIREIADRTDDWWTNDRIKELGELGSRMEKAASHVCASYDILGRMIEFDRLDRFGLFFPKSGYGAFFREYWAPSIIKTHDALANFLAHRRTTIPDAYGAYGNIILDKPNSHI